jgi:mono/diheme cytochrome c family protein
MSSKIAVRILTLTTAFGLAAIGALAQGAKPALYTGDQANAGATVYSQSCATCHGPALEGTAAPALKGAVFTDTATAQSMTADTLYDVIAGTMPQSDPGSLKAEEYAAVTAYILQQNGYPAGAAPLAKGAAGLKDAKITP